MSQRATRRPAFSQLLGKLRGVLVAYCLLAIPASFDSPLLAQLAWVDDSADTQPADDDGDMIESAAAQAILPAPARRSRLLSGRLLVQNLSATHARRYFPSLSYSCLCPATRPMVRKGVGIPLRC